MSGSACLEMLILLCETTWLWWRVVSVASLKWGRDGIGSRSQKKNAVEGRPQEIEHVRTTVKKFVHAVLQGCRMMMIGSENKNNKSTSRREKQLLTMEGKNATFIISFLFPFVVRQSLIYNLLSF